MAGNPDKLKMVRQVKRSDILFALAAEADLSRVFAGSSDAGVHVFDLKDAKAEGKPLGGTGATDGSVGHRGWVLGVARAGAFVISGAYDGKLIWWEAETGKPVRTVDAHRKLIRRVVASPDGSTIASIADDMVCKLWDAATGAPRGELRGHAEITPHDYPSMLYACAFSDDGKQLATADKVGHIVIWDVASGKQIKSVEATEMYTWDPKQRRHSIGGVRSVAFSHDGRTLACGGMGKVGNIDHLEGRSRVEVFDLAKGERTHVFEGDKSKGLVEQIAFLPGDQLVLGCGGDGKGLIGFYDLKSKKMIKEDTAPMHVHDFVVNRAGDAFVAVGYNTLAMWEFK